MRGIMKGLNPLVQMRSREHQQPLCDNLKHEGHISGQSSGAPQSERTCSGCYSVVYCSQKCQLQDWKALHRAECSHMYQRHLDGKQSRQHYPHSLRKYQTNLTRHCYESTEVLRRTFIETGTARRSAYVPHDVAQSVCVLPGEDQDRGLAWGSPLSLYLQRTADHGAVPPDLIPRFHAFANAFRQSVEESMTRVPISSSTNSSHETTFPNDCEGSLRLVERSFRRGGQREINVVLLLRQTRTVHTYPGCTHQEAHAKAAEFFFRDVGEPKEPIFEIVSSMVYQCAKREFVPLQSVPRSEWPDAYLDLGL
ncbi:hypothetical protein NMY22_g16034 [Coprinellus aureogranulatus]|nr:hypothetical protein NMY22_g16034 [Coprinellus aureogranulatus]